MGNLLRIRRMMQMAEEQGPEDLVASFSPGTYSWGWTNNMTCSATIPFVINHTYRVVLDATTESSTRVVIFISDRNYGQNALSFSYGQDGEITKTFKTTRGTMTKNFWIYCRPSSNDSQNHSVTLRSIKIYDIT